MINELKDIEGISEVASKSFCQSLHSQSLCRKICPVDIIDKNKFYLAPIPQQDVYYFDCDKNDTIFLETSKPIETSSNCISYSISKVELEMNKVNIITIITGLIDKLIKKENENFLSFIKSLCPEDTSYQFSEEDDCYITSDFFPKDNIKKYPAKVFKTNKLQKTEVLALRHANISVFSGKPFIQIYDTPWCSATLATDTPDCFYHNPSFSNSISIIASIPNFTMVFRKNNEYDIRKILLPESYAFTSNIEEDLTIKISQEELVFRAMNRETLLLDI